MINGESDTSERAPIGVLLMAYGTPENLDQVEAYFTHIRGGRTPSPESVKHLQERYALVGGQTPLLAITRQTEQRLQEVLDSTDPGMYRVFIGMKHWHPFIGDVVPRIAAEGVRTLVAIPLAPHYSRISIGGYRKSVDEANEKLDTPLDVHFVESWHLHPQFIQMVASRVQDALQQFPSGQRDQVTVLFSAHSLPERIRTWNDPYESQLLETSRVVSELAGVRDWRFAFQSASNTGEPWLGPDIVDFLETLHSEGVRNVLSVPIGFVAEHLEILYDIDYEAKHKADELGITLRRIQMPNASDQFIRILADIVEQQTQASHTPLEAAV